MQDFKYCSACGQPNDLSAQFCQRCGAKYGDEPMDQNSQTLASPSATPVLISLDADGRFQGIEIRVKTQAEAKLALKELKLKKKEFSLQKRQINEQQRIIRARYTQEIRARGSKMHGGGAIGRVVRAFQTATRDAARSRLASDLEPYERQKQYIEAVIAAIENAILQLESAMLREF